MAAILFVILIVVPLAAFGGWKLYRLYRISNVWRRAAADHGLEYSPGVIATEFQLSGTYREVPVRVETVTAGPDEETVSTRFTAALPDAVPSGAVISDERGTELSADAPDIAEHFSIRSDPSDQLDGFLEQPEVARAFELLIQSDKHVEITDGQLVLRTAYFVEYRLEIDETLETLADFCHEIRDVGTSNADGAEESGDADGAASEKKAESREYVRNWN